MADLAPEIVLDTVREIVRLESAPTPDWSEVEKISDRIIDNIHKLGIFDQVEFEVYKFLEDYDIRRKDSAYGRGQRSYIMKILP